MSDPMFPTLYKALAEVTAEIPQEDLDRAENDPMFMRVLSERCSREAMRRADPAEVAAWMAAWEDL